MRKKLQELMEQTRRIIRGKEEEILKFYVCLFCGGHLLIEDLPGLGKTTLALTAAKLLDLEFKRIQCTPDLMPSDIVGTTIFDKAKSEFVFKKGAVFTNLLLVDEINRAMPKTQSALLEAMEERQVSVEGKTYKLPKPFFVIATQNPIEFSGTFPLPESQLDRFTMKMSLGYPNKEVERNIILGKNPRDMVKELTPVFSAQEVVSLIKETEKVFLPPKTADYIVDIAWATRDSEKIEVGLSVRGTMALARAAKTMAYFRGRDFVAPEDVYDITVEVVAHRLILKSPFSQQRPEEVVVSVLESVKPPV